MPNYNYDARRRPNRGVKVRPLPRHCHQRFREFCSDLRTYCQSHYSTWRLASTEFPQDVVQANAIYWRSALRFVNDIEYLGAKHDHHRRAPR